MRTEQRHYLSLAAGIIVLGFLGYQAWQAPLTFNNLSVGLTFFFLIVFTTTFGVPVPGGVVSLLPMTTVSAFLVGGALPAGLAAFFGAFLNEGVRYVFNEQLGIQRRLSKFGTLSVACANAAIQTTSILIGGWIYRLIGGTVPFTRVTGLNIVSLIALGSIYLVANIVLIAVYMLARGPDVLKMYLKSLPNVVLFEASPLIFLPLLPLIYTQLGYGIFLLFGLAIVVVSLISRSLALTSRGLERRIQELDSLQAVGQALSASLRLDDILPAIYEQVTKLMPVDNFYVALYFPDANEVTFPLVVEDNKRVSWQPRQAGKGLTEYLLNNQEPLLISSNLSAKLDELEIQQHGKLAASWLGVPIMAGDESLGVIAVQSYTETELYDESHKEVLFTIAAQAGIAIQNARLYERTDEALARRVQELNSILKTSAEGMLLLRTDWRILAANRALAEFFLVPQTELSGGDWGSVGLDRSPDLLLKLGYTFESLQDDCLALSKGNGFIKVHDFSLPGPPTRYLKRTHTPVLDRDNQIAGWLLVFRDMTEEIELTRLREDMTHMLVHDLRSPLTALVGSLWILRKDIDSIQENSQAQEMIAMAERNANRMMNMVTGLLDIAKLENSQVPLCTEVLSVPDLFEEISSRIAPIAIDAQIELKTIVAPDLPCLKVDSEHIRRAISNLVDNALKFTPDGGHVTLWARSDDENHPATSLIGVTDSGPGISMDAQKKLFQKFHTNSSIRGRRKGTGLGLAYCKLVVEAHEGEIWVQSQVGQGSTFIMRLPIERQ